MNLNKDMKHVTPSSFQISIFKNGTAFSNSSCNNFLKRLGKVLKIRQTQENIKDDSRY